MKRSGAVKFPNSVELFKFCQKVLVHRRGGKVHDQEVGAILNFNPSDCSHWKRGEKNVKSVFALAKLAEHLNVEATLIHDLAGGSVGLDEAYFEFLESREFQDTVKAAEDMGVDQALEVRQRIEAFVASIHGQSEFSTPPLYLPEVMRFFAFIKTQPAEMVDKLSRILRIKPGQYVIHFRKGDLRAQTRMSIAKDLSRIVFEGERDRFPEIGSLQPDLVKFEEVLFVANLLVPKDLLLKEINKLDSRRNVVSELATTFWVPKSLIGFQLQEILRGGRKTSTHSTTVAPMPKRERENMVAS